MARSLSATARRAIYAPQTGEAFLVLLTLDHASLGAPIRVTSDSVPTTHDGDTYQPFPFIVSIPDEPEDAMPQARLQIDNVDRAIAMAIQNASGDPISVDLRVVTASEPDTIECGPYAMSLSDVRGDALAVEGKLSFEPILNEPFPAGEFGPTNFTGLFR